MSEVILVRCTPGERTAIDAAAAELGVSVSRYMAVAAWMVARGKTEPVEVHFGPPHPGIERSRFGVVEGLDSNKSPKVRTLRSGDAVRLQPGDVVAEVGAGKYGDPVYRVGWVEPTGSVRWEGGPSDDAESADRVLKLLGWKGTPATYLR